MVVAAAFPCWAQTSPSSTAAPSNPATSPAPDGAGNRQEMLRKLEGMTPDQRQEFLLNHPKLQQFIDNHPKLEQKLANGSGGDGTGNARIMTSTPSTPAASGEEGNRQEMLRKLEGMTPDQRQQFLQNHPKLQQFVDNHPKLEQKLANGSEAGAGIKDPGHPRVNEVNQREENQQDRIAQGVSNGTLSPQEAAKLEKGESRIQQQEAQDLQKNNGHLTPAEQAKLNSEENRLSHRIHHEKHEK